MGIFDAAALALTYFQDGTGGNQLSERGAKKEPIENMKIIKSLILLARPERFELPTPRFVVWCSIQLSYGRLGCGCSGSGA